MIAVHLGTNAMMVRVTATLAQTASQGGVGATIVTEIVIPHLILQMIAAYQVNPN